MVECGIAIWLWTSCVRVARLRAGCVWLWGLGFEQSWLAKRIVRRSLAIRMLCLCGSELCYGESCCIGVLKKVK